MSEQRLPRAGYKVLRTRSTSDDTDLDTANATAANQTGSSRGTNGVWVPKLCVSMQMIFVGTDAEDETMTWKLYGYKPISTMAEQTRSPQPAEYVANGTATLGKQVVDPTSSTTVYYADTIAITAEAGVYDVLFTTAGANSSGSIAKLIMNNPGFEYIYMVMTKNSSCASIGSYVTWH